MSAFKYTKQTYKNQAQSQIKIDYRSIDPQKDPSAYFSNCPLAGQLVYAALLRLSNVFKDIYPSQQAIANLAGVSRNAAGKYLRIFHQDKALWMVGTYAETSLYKIPAYIIKSAPRLKHLFVALSFMSIGLLFSVKNNCQSERIPLDSSLPLSITDTRQTQSHNFTVLRATRGRESQDKEKITIPKKESGMPQDESTFEMGERPIVEYPNVLDNLKSVKLTEAGKVWMSGFTEADIRKADEVLSRKSSVSDPFRYLFAVAKKHCEESGRRPDWAKRSNLATRLSVSDNSVMVESYKPAPSQSTQLAQHKSFAQSQSHISKPSDKYKDERAYYAALSNKKDAAYKAKQLEKEAVVHDRAWHEKELTAWKKHAQDNSLGFFGIDALFVATKIAQHEEELLKLLLLEQSEPLLPSTPPLNPVTLPEDNFGALDGWQWEESASVEW